MANLSDFDFDELDKAVAGALSDTQSDAESEVDTTPVSAQKEEETPAPVAPPPAPAARRSSGRFMDVVHPSSDMRTKSSFTPPVNSPAAPAQPPQSTPSTLDEDAQDWAKPLESPFLPDAKVEKRPLGTMPATGSAPKEDELLLEAPDEPLLGAHTMPDPIDFAAHASALPSEQEDTGSPVETTEEEVTVEPEPIKEEATEAPVEVEEVQPELPVSKVEEPVRDAEPIGSASISQQYTEQPSTSPESGAIYDTESYHQPLAPAPKKKSGAWVFVWILLLLIVGAAAGAGFYFFVLPML